jgi:hypothetical protein
MKNKIRFISIFTFILIGCFTLKAGTINVDTSGLSTDVKQAIAQKLQQDAITDKINTYGKWVGFGKEVGIASREALTAVKDVALNIANSKLGDTIMFLIVWKVAGRDMIRIIIAMLFSIVCIWLVSKSYFRLFTTKTLIKKTGWWIFSTKEYAERKLPENVLKGMDNSWVAGFHWFFLCIMIGIASLIAFV